MDKNVGTVVQVGDMLAGKYRVERVLGRGAMGLVVAATHVDLRELRAIKLMLPTMLSDTEGVERFMREARAAARLKSQHVVKVYDVGKLETGAPYMVMEYLEGTDLKSLLDVRRYLPLDEAARYMIQACESIGEAHSLGIIHRDLKPANIFLTSGVGGTPCIKVLDFGIAKVTPHAGSAEADMTSTNMIMGSPLYMSPEQMRSTRYVDVRSDIWSLGVVLYGLVSGGLPFVAESTQILIACVLRDPPHPIRHWRSDLPPGIEAVILRCLEKDPARRFQSVAELAEALARFTVPAPRPSQISMLDSTEKLPAQPFRSPGTDSPGQSAPAYAASVAFPQAVPAPASSRPSQPGAPASWSGHGLSPGMSNAFGSPSVGQTNIPSSQTGARVQAWGDRRGLLVAGGIVGTLAAVGITALLLALRSQDAAVAPVVVNAEMMQSGPPAAVATGDTPPSVVPQAPGPVVSPQGTSAAAVPSINEVKPVQASGRAQTGSGAATEGAATSGGGKPPSQKTTSGSTAKAPAEDPKSSKSTSSDPFGEGRK